MAEPALHVLSLRYSSWSIRPWLALTAANASFSVETHDLPDVGVELAESVKSEDDLESEASRRLARRRGQGSVTGLFPVLDLGGQAIHESLAICEWVADRYPDAGLWPPEMDRRAQARAVSCEMMTGFSALRSTMPCQVFARVSGIEPDAATRIDLARVFELWRSALDASGGPYLFGSFGVPDCMYFPVLTRFRTYGVDLPEDLEAYARRLEASPAVERWREVAASAPTIPSYDAAMRALGGDPDAALSS